MKPALELHTPQPPPSIPAHVCDDPDCGLWNAHLYWVALYEVSQKYGGPEEGGWWYDTGDLITDPELYAAGVFPQSFGHLCEARAGRERLQMSANVLNAKRRSHEPQYFAEIHERSLPDFYPESRPRYE